MNGRMRQRGESESGSFTVYRLYSIEQEALYVGCSYASLARLNTHARDREWFGEVAYAHFEHFPSKREALNAERYHIERLRPKYNGTLSELRTSDEPPPPDTVEVEAA